MSDEQKAQAELLWTNDRIIGLAKDTCRRAERTLWEKEANIVDALRTMRADYEATLTAQAQRIAELERRLKDALTKIVYYEEPLKPLDLCHCAHKFTDEGICIRCGEDAEEWDAGCVEEFVRQDMRHEQAARALWRALHEREHCDECGVGGTEMATGTVIDEDGHEVQCECSIKAERVLAAWQELAKGNDDETYE